mmetsp:Transcript_111569/g.315046  ORF Transcript_111569/g.315046 Transcript_111569/m.315046 type:complete len:283 (-) Transcript_111569:77-925(-)
MASALQRPLLGNDIETGPPTKQELDNELKEGTLTWMDLIMFFTNPAHWVVTSLVGFSFFCLFFELLYEGDKIMTKGVPKWSPMVETATICLAAMGGSAYSAFLGVQLQEQVMRFRELNVKLAKNRDRLTVTAKDLKDKEMASFADHAGSGFQDIFDKACNVLDDMEEVVREDIAEVLSVAAQNIEFMNDEEGMTADEYDAFTKRLPKNFKAPPFETVANGKDTATFEDIQSVIDSVKGEVDVLRLNTSKASIESAMFNNAVLPSNELGTSSTRPSMPPTMTQ